MAEVAEAGEADGPVGEHLARLGRVEARLREGMGAFGNEEAGDEPADDGQGRGRPDYRLPLETAEPVDEMRRRRPDCESPHQDAQRHSSSLLEPGRGQLERGRVDARQEHPREKAQGDGERYSGSDEQEEVGGRGPQ